MVIGSRTQGVFFQGKKEEGVEKLPRANVRVPGATALKSPMPYSQEKLERPSTKGYLYPKPTLVGR